MSNAQKVAANKKKVAANAKKVQANREKVALGKYSPNSGFISKSGVFTATNSKGDVDFKTNRLHSEGKIVEKPTDIMYEAFGYGKPRVTVATLKPGQKGYERKIQSATSMDTTGYAAGKKTFVKNTKKAVGSGGNAYKQTSKKVARKDVPKTLAEMQKMRRGGVKGKKVTEKSTKESYKSKAAMMKHEKGESKKMKMKEGEIPFFMKKKKATPKMKMGGKKC